MNDDEYAQLARFLRARIEEHGLDDIAEFSHYEVEEEGERSLPPPRDLVVMMLRAIDRLFVINDERVISDSLGRISRSIDDGDGPNQAVVHFEQDRLDVNPEESQVLRGITGIETMRSDLNRLLRQIEEDQEQ